MAGLRAQGIKFKGYWPAVAHGGDGFYEVTEACVGEGFC